MSGTIKVLSVHYDPVNESNTFTNGDIVEGRAILEVTKEMKVNSLFVKCTGDAHVHWTESSSNDTETSYYDHERYFKLKQYFIQDSSKKDQEEKNTTLITGETYGQVVKPGSHVFPFRFQLPQINMPPSFKGAHGWVKYIVEVKLNRPWKMACTKSEELNFVTRNDGTNDNLLQPQTGTKDKKMKFFASGKTSMTATMDKTGYMQGETIRIFVDTDNSLSRDVKLKYSLSQKQTFIAGGSTNNAYRNIVKEVKDRIPSGEKTKVTIDLKLPPDITVSIENCRIIQVQYELKVYLDVPFASDPEIKFPVVILPVVQQFSPWPCPPYSVLYPPSAPDELLSAPAAGLYPCLYNPEYTKPPYPGVFSPASAELYPNAMSSGFHPAPVVTDVDSNQSTQGSSNWPY